MHGVNITAIVDLITGTQNIDEHALCDTQELRNAIGSLNYIRYHDACTPIIQGDVATTDEFGNATFSNFSIIR